MDDVCRQLLGNLEVRRGGNRGAQQVEYNVLTDQQMGEVRLLDQIALHETDIGKRHRVHICKGGASPAHDGDLVFRLFRQRQRQVGSDKAGGSEQNHVHETASSSQRNQRAHPDSSGRAQL